MTVRQVKTVGLGLQEAADSAESTLYKQVQLEPKYRMIPIRYLYFVVEAVTRQVPATRCLSAGLIHVDGCMRFTCCMH